MVMVVVVAVMGLVVVVVGLVVDRGGGHPSVSEGCPVPSYSGNHVNFLDDSFPSAVAL